MKSNNILSTYTCIPFPHDLMGLCTAISATSDPVSDNGSHVRRFDSSGVIWLCTRSTTLCEVRTLSRCTIVNAIDVIEYGPSTALALKIQLIQCIDDEA